MKRIGTMLMASLLLLGLTQCKKEQKIEPDTDEGVYITVDVNGGSKGSRVIVDPNAPGGYATVAFEEGDKLYVANNGYYRGYLLYQDGKFKGKIEAYSDDYLHFYFVGGCTPEGISTTQQAVPGIKTSFTVNITDQTEKYPVIAYGHSTIKYDAETTSYSATLDNYCSIMKVPIEGAGTANTVTLRGMNNQVTVDLNANNGDVTGDPFTFSSSPELGYGEIMFHNQSDNEKWAVVLPQNEDLAQLHCDGFKDVFVSVPEITADRYYDDDIDGITLVPGTTTSEFPFSVAANTQVYFSLGNLQAVFAEANTSSCTWRFADHQYDYIGDAVANTVVGNNCVTTAGTVDLFAWVGVNSRFAAYGINNNIQLPWYDGDQLKEDWGVAANAASLGGYNTWRTLAIDEWEYLSNTRTTSVTINGIDNARYTQATINTDGTPVNGIILFPDDGYWGPTTNAAGITFGAINGNGTSGWGTQCTTSGWISLENAGCVFLPAAGYRSLSDPDDHTWEAGSLHVMEATHWGYYWSTTPYEGGDFARAMRFTGTSVGFATSIINGILERSNGGSVRLVRPAE